MWHTAGRIANAYASPLGWLAAAASMACATGFAVWGWHELLAATIALTAMLTAAIAMSLGNAGFDTVIGVSRRRAAIGDAITVTVDIDNPGSTPTTSVFGDLVIGETHERFRIPSLAPGLSKRMVVEFTAVRRAALSIGPLRVRQGDPFGLVRRERELAGHYTVFVHPPTTTLKTPDAGLVRDLEGRPSGQIADDDLDLHGLRPYEPGDDVRHVHWLSTAKTGALMIRQYEATRRTDTSVTLDVDPGDYADAQEFELAVSVHASIGVQCLLWNRPLVSYAGRSFVVPDSVAGFLDWCSAIEPEPDGDPRVHGRHAGGNAYADGRPHTTDTGMPRSGDRSPTADGLNPTGPDPIGPDPIGPNPISPNPISPNSISPNPTGPNPTEAMPRHDSDASFRYFTIGSRGDPNRFGRMASARSGSSVLVVLRTDPGAERNVRRHAGFAVATVGALDDLPLVMEALV